MQRIIDKVSEFAELPKGWHFGEGVPPSAKNISEAQTLVAKAEELGFANLDVFPGIDGEIQIAIYQSEDDYEFTLEKNGTITFVHDINEREVRYEPGLSLAAAVETLVRLSDKVCPSSDSFTASTMIKIADAFVVWLSKTPATVREYRLSKANVLSERVQQSVTILSDSTLLWRENQSFTGQYRWKRCQMGASSSKRTVRLGTNAITTLKSGLTRTLVSK